MKLYPTTVAVKLCKCIFFPSLFKGLKEDGKRDKEVQPITPAVAQVLAKEIGASSYVETSSLKHIGIDLVCYLRLFQNPLPSFQTIVISEGYLLGGMERLFC